MHEASLKWLTPEAVKFAERVEATINDAIGRADPNAIGGAINWADLGCISIEFDTDGGVCALVSEASPDAGNLVQYLCEALKAEDLDAWVRTEW